MIKKLKSPMIVAICCVFMLTLTGGMALAAENNIQYKGQYANYNCDSQDLNYDGNAYDNDAQSFNVKSQNNGSFSGNVHNRGGQYYHPYHEAR